MITEKEIQNKVETYLIGTDKFLVEVKIKPTNLIYVFIDSDTSVTIDDCVDLSRHIESEYDREVEDYELNVSSAGLDQPFKMKRQYLKHKGKEVAIKLEDGKKLKGTLIECNGDQITLQPLHTGKKAKAENAGPLTIPMADIKEAKAVISFN